MGIPMRRSGSSLSLSLSRNRIALDNFLKKPHCIIVLDAPLKNREEYLVVNGIKKFFNIAFQNKAWMRAIFADFPRHGVKSRDASVRAVTNATRKGRSDKCRLENRIDNGEYGVMQDAIPHERFVDMPLLGILNIKSGICSVAIDSMSQVIVQLKKIFLQISLKCKHIKLILFTCFKRLPCHKEILQRYDLHEKVAIDFHRCYG